MTEPTFTYAPAQYRPAKLFIRRVALFWQKVWGCWRTALDWMIWLYIVVPAVLILGGMYLDTWHSPPEWFALVPVTVVLSVLGLAQFVGGVRTFADAGDGLFLHRIPVWTRGLARGGLLYLLCMRLLIAVATVGLVSTVLYNGLAFAISDMLLLGLWSVVHGLLSALASDMVGRKESGWRKIVLQLLIRMLLLAIFVWVAAVGREVVAVYFAAVGVYMVLIGLLARSRVYNQGSFQHDVEAERKAFSALIGWLLMNVLDKKQMPRRRQPILFARSQRLIRGERESDRLADLGLKSMLRNSDHVMRLLQFIGVGSIALMMPAPVVAVCIYPVLPMLVLLWLNGLWRQWIGESFMAMFQWRQNDLVAASRAMKLRLIVPVLAVWGIVVGVRVGLLLGGGWLGWGLAIIVPVAGCLWGHVLNGIMTDLDMLRVQRKAR